MSIHEPGNTNQPKPATGKFCNIQYLLEIVNGNRKIAKEIMDLFLEQVPIELTQLNEATASVDYPHLKALAHTMKSSLSVMGITAPLLLLHEIEELGGKAIGIEKIRSLNDQLQLQGIQVIAEVTAERSAYV